MSPSHPHSAIAWLFGYDFFVSMMSAGLVSSSVSSLERRYGFTKTMLGVLLATTDVVSCVCAMPVGLLGTRPRAHKAHWIATFYVLSAIGALLFGCVYFMSGRYSPLGGLGDSPVCTPSGSGSDDQ